MENEFFRIEIDRTAGRVRLVGDVDLNTSRGLTETLLESGCTEVDCSELGFLDSSGVREFASAHCAFEERGETLLFTGLTGALLQILKLTNLDTELHLA